MFSDGDRTHPPLPRRVRWNLPKRLVDVIRAMRVTDRGEPTSVSPILASDQPSQPFGLQVLHHRGIKLKVECIMDFLKSLSHKLTTQTYLTCVILAVLTVT